MNIRPAPLLSWFAVWLNGLISAASAQAVAFADLAGTTISYTLVFDQVVLREGREIPVQVEQNIKLIIGPGDTIHSTAVNTSHNPYGTRQGEPRITTTKLAKAKELQTLGGGHGVWAFIDGTLNFLRTYKSGAYRQSIAFARATDGLTCSEVTIVRAKQVSSTCRVAKGS